MYPQCQVPILGQLVPSPPAPSSLHHDSGVSSSAVGSVTCHCTTHQTRLLPVSCSGPCLCFPRGRCLPPCPLLPGWVPLALPDRAPSFFPKAPGTIAAARARTPSSSPLPPSRRVSSVMSHIQPCRTAQRRVRFLKAGTRPRQPSVFMAPRMW